METSLDEATIVDRARQKGIRLLPFSDFYAVKRPGPINLLIGFGGIPAKEIRNNFV